jgi:hypothetical protein
MSSRGRRTKLSTWCRGCRQVPNPVWHPLYDTEGWRTRVTRRWSATGGCVPTAVSMPMRPIT